MNEWIYLRRGLLAVAVLCLAALVGTGVDRLLAGPPQSAVEKVTNCLVNEKGVTLSPVHDPIAENAGLGALRTVVETNGVTIAVASDVASAERVVAAYERVSSGLEGRLERRGRLVYLWDRVASPTQRQALFDCEY